MSKMFTLTAKQEMFAQAYVRTGHTVHSYIVAFGKKGSNMSAMLKTQKMKRRIQELRNAKR